MNDIVKIIMLVVGLYYIKMNIDMLIKVYFLSKPLKSSTSDAQWLSESKHAIFNISHKIIKLYNKRSLKNTKPPVNINFKR